MISAILFFWLLMLLPVHTLTLLVDDRWLGALVSSVLGTNGDKLEYLNGGLEKLDDIRDRLEEKCAESQISFACRSQMEKAHSDSVRAYGEVVNSFNALVDKIKIERSRETELEQQLSDAKIKHTKLEKDHAKQVRDMEDDHAKQIKKKESEKAVVDVQLATAQATVKQLKNQVNSALRKAMGHVDDL